MSKKTIICSMCGKNTEKTTTARQKYCPECRSIADKERKRKHYKKNNPNAYSPKPQKKCAVCGESFSSSFDGVPYCNKHYQKMYHYGTLEPVRKKTNSYTISNNVVTFFTSKNEPFLVDKEDFDKVYKSTWTFNQSGRYLVATIKQKVIRLHRFILNINDPNLVVDHVNGDPSDNRKNNLRVTTQRNNTRNSRVSKNNTSGYPGVNVRPSGNYRARITVNRKEITLGTFPTFEEAKQVRIDAENKYYKEYSPSKGVLK